MSASHRLAAIAVADVAGYSRLMEADEEGTLAALKDRRYNSPTHGARISIQLRTLATPRKYAPRPMTKNFGWMASGKQECLLEVSQVRFCRPLESIFLASE